jgi:hypothetical protein
MSSRKSLKSGRGMLAALVRAGEQTVGVRLQRSHDAVGKEISGARTNEFAM